ncbi:glycosyltransferase [Acidisphaera sp. L21]|uniref:glycosyltransferase n=1 Tax=Acidisphaera sp. L21 TaxID=1641851 RepID=UPI00131E5029|nr:glycosyltransferase family 1 protein [Acidisphaera sp. L21]
MSMLQDDVRDRADPSPGFNHLVTLGDASRDVGQWMEAAHYYELAVGIQPGVAGIWEQLGHAYKEHGSFSQAGAAYLKAHSLNPGDVGLLVQLGHFHALRDATPKALDYYQRAVTAGSQDEHALRYIAQSVHCRAADPARQSASTAIPAIYFEYTDLLDHCRSNRTPTGIQRVQIELFRASLLWDSPVPIRACAYADQKRGWVDVNPDELLALLDLGAQRGNVADPDWQEALARFFTALDTRAACVFPVGAALINLGTSWGIENYMAAIRTMKARFGLRYVPFVHDLIPLMTPEYVDHGVTAAFNAWLSSAILHGDLFAVTSSSTRNDLVKAAAQIRPLSHDPIAMPLDAAPSAPRQGHGGAHTAQTRERLGLANTDFVLFVGTMEARKNHYLVFQAWVKLLASHDRSDVPVLVCVGKRGWKFERAQSYLEAHPELDGKVMILSGISDAELATLYAECQFTLYASLYEGWGLPVTESLHHGKACLTADHSSLPEAGGQFADYYEGDSVKSLTSQAERLIFDRSYRESREHLIATQRQSQDWQTALQTLVLATISHFPTPAVPAILAAPIVPATIYRIGNQPFFRRLDRGAAIAEMLRAGGGWYGVDAATAWSKDRRARLAFQLPPVADTDHVVFLKLRAPPEKTSLTLSLAGTLSARLTLRPGEARIVRLDLSQAPLAGPSTGERPIVILLQVDQLVSMAKYDPANTRQVGIGVEMFMACAVEDDDARLAILECALMTLEDA